MTDVPKLDPDFAAKHKQAFLDYLDSDGEGNFDMYAQDPGVHAELSAVIPGLVVTSAGGMVPFQAEGTLQGHRFYFRYRGGHVTLSVGSTNGKPPYSGNCLYAAGMSLGGPYDGCMNTQDFYRAMLMLVPQLERGSFRYEFRGRKVTVEEGLIYTPTDEEDVFYGWGKSPEEAFAACHKPSEYLVSKGWSEEKQRELHELQRIERKPINTDDREYPAVDPAFTVLVTPKPFEE